MAAAVAVVVLVRRLLRGGAAAAEACCGGIGEEVVSVWGDHSPLRSGALDVAGEVLMFGFCVFVFHRMFFVLSPGSQGPGRPSDHAVFEVYSWLLRWPLGSAIDRFGELRETWREIASSCIAAWRGELRLSRCQMIRSRLYGRHIGRGECGVV